MESKIFTKRELKRLSWRWALMGQLCWNYGKMQGGGYLATMVPAIEKLYKDDEDAKKKALVAHSQLFNITPHLGHMVLGIDLAIEEREGIKAIDTVSALKTSLMGPLSGIGDSIFAVMNSVIFGSLAATMAVEGNPIGVVLWQCWYMVALFVLRPWFFRIGYSQGISFVGKMSDRLGRISRSISSLGLIVVGGMIPTMVRINFADIQIGDSVLNLGSGLLNKIVPSLPQALLAIGLYALISKGKITTTKLIFVVILFSILMSVTGILVP